MKFKHAIMFNGIDRQNECPSIENDSTAQKAQCY